MKKQIIVVCDFDGTISVEDVNSSIFHTFGNEKTREVGDRYKNSEIGLRESLKTQYEIIGIDKNTFDEFVLSRMDIDKTFFDFTDYAGKNGIKVAVVSGGFINYVRLLLEKYGRKIDIPVYSNLLVEKDGRMVPQYGEVPKCIKHYGPCGLCKLKHILDYKKDYMVIYVGDGYTDRCAAESADVVFAKDGLREYCIENGISFMPFSSFKDIEDYLKGILSQG